LGNWWSDSRPNGIIQPGIIRTIQRDSTQWQTNLYDIDALIQALQDNPEARQRLLAAAVEDSARELDVAIALDGGLMGWEAAFQKRLNMTS